MFQSNIFSSECSEGTLTTKLPLDKSVKLIDHLYTVRRRDKMIIYHYNLKHLNFPLMSSANDHANSSEPDRTPQNSRTGLDADFT